MPIINTMMIAKNTQPVKIIMKTAIQPAYFCFSPRTARNMCPPSSCPAGNRFIDVIRRPIHPANAVKLKSIDDPKGILCIELIRNEKSREDPSIISPEIGSVIEIWVELIIPNIVIGNATRKPAKGPDNPISNNAFLLGIGSELDIRAPNVPILKFGRIGGMGMKKGSDVLIPCFFEIK